jgi:UDP:flavonoid glycosyltransferase YjiC (YdhE family)
MIALGRALRARGHEVTLETWTRWQAGVEAEGMAFAPAPEYHVFPTQERPLKSRRCGPTSWSPTS